MSATVTASFPGSGTATGSVDFFDITTAVDLGSMPLSNGLAALSTSGADARNACHHVDLFGRRQLSFEQHQRRCHCDQPVNHRAGPDGECGDLAWSGNAFINVSDAVYVDSGSSSAVSLSGNSRIKAAVIDVHGGVQMSGNATISPTPITKAASLADPLAGLAGPSTGGAINHGSYALSGNSKATISPGIYGAISVRGNAVLTLAAGIYIIEGGGLSISGNASVSGAGVLIYNAGSCLSRCWRKFRADQFLGERGC